MRPAGPITEQAGSRLTAGALPDASEIALYAATHPGQARRSNGASRHPRHGGERGATGMDPAPYVERVAGGGPFVGVKCTVRKGGRVWPSGLSGPCGSDHQPGHDGTASREAGQRYRRGTGRGERSQADTFQLTVSIDRGGSAAPRGGTCLARSGPGRPPLRWPGPLCVGLRRPHRPCRVTGRHHALGARGSAAAVRVWSSPKSANRTEPVLQGLLALASGRQDPMMVSSDPDGRAAGRAPCAQRSSPGERR